MFSDIVTGLFLSGKSVGYYNRKILLKLKPDGLFKPAKPN